MGQTAGEAHIPLILPVHAVYSNLAARITAPLGTSLSLAGVEGYVGQVWTGPVRWAMDQARCPSKSFFGSALILYDSFSELTVGGDRKLWLLVDPIEDDPRHTWEEFRQWYVHCVAAMLMIADVDRYEVMPWPDRIYLPGAPTGGGSPAPADFRTTVLSITAALQNMPAGGQWLDARTLSPLPDSGRVGVAINDSLMWHVSAQVALDCTYGPLMGLVMRGVPASTCWLERADEDGYLDRFDVLVLSYEATKPLSAATHRALARWVRAGHSLVVLGKDRTLAGEEFWWNREGYAGPLSHLLTELGLQQAGEGDHKVGKGWVLRREVSPKAFIEAAASREVYWPLVDQALRLAGRPKGLVGRDAYVMRRGPFLIAHALSAPLTLTGPMVDVLNPRLPVLDRAELATGQSGLYRVVDLDAAGPLVLHATGRVTTQNASKGKLTFEVRGPSGTPSAVRVFWGSRPAPAIRAVGADRSALAVTVRVDGPTLLLEFDGQPNGARLELTAARP
jgi:hypothetical protein